MATVPQTVSFELVVEFNRIESVKKPRTYLCDTFEAMLAHWSKERNRRALKDRATSARYRMHLTEHGKQATAEDAACAARHKDAIDGKWFEM